MDKLKKLQKKVPHQSAFLISNPVNIYYLIGFKGISQYEREALLLITIDKALLIVSKMYEHAIPINFSRSDFNKIHTLHKQGFVEKLTEILPDTTRTLYLEEDNLLVSEYKALRYKTADLSLKLKALKSEICDMRAVKTVSEVELIARAQKITMDTLQQGITLLEKGGYKNFTEISFAEKLRNLGIENGADTLSFDIIVASGKASAQPHYAPMHKLITPNSCLLIDMGFKYKGYCGDLTRTFYIGKPDSDFIKNYEIVLACNQYALELLSQNISLKQLQNQIQKFFQKYNVSKYFIHSIGHGVGLEIHEFPFVQRKKTQKLSKGNIFTVEPGLYFPDNFGIRIEDMIVKTQQGIKFLNTDTFKNLYIIS